MSSRTRSRSRRATLGRHSEPRRPPLPAARRSYARFLPAAIVFAASAVYFASQLTVREASVLEAQDFGIACDLFETFSLSPDHSPLHFIFVNLWQRLDASSIAFLRLPSVVFCSLAAVVVHALAKDVAGRAAGILAAAFFATNPQVVDNARSMRMYSLGLLAAAMCLWLAHAYLTTRRRSALIGLCVSSLVGVYNHLFAWLLIGSIALVFGLDLWKNRRPRTERLLVMKWFGATFVLLLPQLVHVFVAIAFTRGRHALYRGLPSDPSSFLLPIVRTLFLGESEHIIGVRSVLLVAPVALVALGIGLAKRAGRVAATAILLPAVVVAWILGLSNPVEPRYLNFLTPVIAVLMGTGAVRAKRAGWWAPLSVGVIVLSCWATRVAYADPVTDWPSLQRRLATVRREDDVVAVFPGYWSSTYRRYAGSGETTPVTFPVDLERALARGKRVLLVRGPGREFGSIESLLAAKTNFSEVFRTDVRDIVVVYAVSPKTIPRAPPRTAPGIVLMGMVGSGGYAWQGRPAEANPFAALTDLVAGDVAVAGYAPYRVPWHASVLLGSDQVQRVEAPAVLPFFAKVGIRGGVLACRGPDACASGAKSLAAAGVDVIRRAPVVYDVGGTQVGVFATTADDPSVEETVRDARSRVGASGRLVAFVPAAPDYGRLPTAGERVTARHLVDLGVDVVAGMGGFAAKEIEHYGRGVIAYSLGTLLRPQRMILARADSTGIAVRASFVRDAPPVVEVVPTTFDDLSRPAIAQATTIEHLANHGAVLSDDLEHADAGYSSREGERHELGPWRTEQRSLAAGVERWVLDTAAPLTEWFPEAPPNTALRPFDGARSSNGAYVARRGVLDAGAFERAIELDSGGNASVWVRFRGVSLGTTTNVFFGLSDDRLRSKYMAFPDQRIVVSVGDRKLLERNVPYRVGFTRVAIDTSHDRGPQDVTITVSARAAHFPVAVDASVSDAP